MRKSNAILLGLVFLLMTAGYLAWCWRPFYLERTFTYESNVPPDAIVAVKAWRKGIDYWDKLPFRYDMAVYLLGRPWSPIGKPRVSLETDRDTVIVNEKGNRYGEADPENRARG